MTSLLTGHRQAPITAAATGELEVPGSLRKPNIDAATWLWGGNVGG